MSHSKEHNRKALIQFYYQYSAYIIDKGFINLYKHYNKYMIELFRSFYK